MTVRSTRPSLFALVAALFVGLGLLFAPAAAAHDQLVSSNPEEGAELDSQPEWIELEFSGEVQEMGSEVQVMHNGENVSAGEIAVEGTTVSSALPDDLGAGEYTIVWRVVSSDGHPISGEIPFTIQDAGGAGGESAAENTEEGEGPGLGAGAVDEEPQLGGEQRGSLEEGEAENTSSGMSTPMIVLLGVGALAVVVMVVLLLMRKNKGLPGTEGDGRRPGTDGRPGPEDTPRRP